MKVATYKTTKEKLINVPLPEDTRTYRRIEHEELINLTYESLYSAGFMLQDEQYSMARDGNIANGLYAIRNIADSEMQIQIGWQNSYNKQISLKYAIGVKIFICQNGAVSGDMGSFKRKHVGDVQEFTPKYIGEYIKTAGEVFIEMQKARDRMKEIEVNKRVAAEIIGRAYLENQFINSTQLNIIKDQFEVPIFDYGCPETLWELYNWTTYSLKDDHPALWLQDHLNTHKFFVDMANELSNNSIQPMVQLEEELSPYKQLSWLDQL